MSFASKHNSVKWSHTAAKDAEYINLSDARMKAVHTVRAIYKNTKSEYGTQYNVLLDDCTTIVDLPKHMNEECEEIIADVDDIKAINDEKVGITRRPYDKGDKTYYTVEWVDL